MLQRPEQTPCKVKPVEACRRAWVIKVHDHRVYVHTCCAGIWVCKMYNLHGDQLASYSARNHLTPSYKPTSFLTPASVLVQVSPYPSSTTPLPIWNAPSFMG